MIGQNASTTRSQNMIGRNIFVSVDNVIIPSLSTIERFRKSQIQKVGVIQNFT